ncbi:MAG TPA: channel protein TolC, partial [Rubrivivax sp.]|nr:channel protein TolC [Rubrivivax sp.]
MRTTALTLAAALAAVLAQGAAAQDLRTLYEAARGFDAAYLAARAQAESAGFRAAQADALVRP